MGESYNGKAEERKRREFEELRQGWAFRRPYLAFNEETFSSFKQLPAFECNEDVLLDFKELDAEINSYSVHNKPLNKQPEIVRPGIVLQVQDTNGKQPWEICHCDFRGMVMLCI